MKEISNRALSILVLLALAISLTSTFVSIQKMSGLVDVTGRLSSTDVGTVNLTVVANAFINVTDNVVDFQSVEVGYVNWSEQIVDFFEVQNVGSTSVNVSIYSSTAGDTGLFGSSTTTGCDGTTGSAGDDTRCIFVRCNATTLGVFGASNCNTAFQEIGNDTNNPTQLVANLTIQSRMNVSVNITVPDDEPAGANKQGAVTLLATACGSDVQCAQ